MKILIIALIIIFVIILVEEIIAEYFFSQVVTRKVRDEKELLKNQISRGLVDKEYYDKLQKEEVWIRTEEGLKQRGIYIKGNCDFNRTIIIVHGITVGISTSIKYMRIFYDRGWNVLMYDQRRHGKSEGKYSTYGYYEKKDLDIWVKWIIKRNGTDGLLGLHGESMGAATVLQYADINKYVDFIIADCAYSNMNELMKYKIKEQTKLPIFPMLQFVQIKSIIRAKFRFKDVSPIDSVRDRDIPVLFIHGKEDTFVPTYMSEEMYKVKKGIKKIYIAEGAVHACSIEIDREQYEENVWEFIEEITKIKLTK